MKVGLPRSPHWNFAFDLHDDDKRSAYNDDHCATTDEPRMSALFRITPSLWDKIHHFASFPQTGGRQPYCLLFPALMYISFSSADGAFWSESIAGDIVESEPIFSGYVVCANDRNMTHSSCRGIARAPSTSRQGTR